MSHTAAPNTAVPMRTAANPRASRRERSCHPKPEIVGAGVGGEPAAKAGAQIPRSAAPGTAAHDTLIAVFAWPRRSVDRCAKIIVVPTVLDPIIAVAVNLIETPRIGREGGYGKR